MFIKIFTLKNVTFVSIIIYLGLFGVVNYIKPSMFYNPDGSLRDFGIGYKNKTILPVWLLAILLAILVYVFVYYCAICKI